MKKSAVISECGRYRYALGRRWDDALPVCVFVMLNPSTADADIDDPTIRRCISFAKREGCGAICVVNLYAFRATEPKDMKNATDPFGPNNIDTLGQTFEEARRRNWRVIVAWGAHGTYLEADVAIATLAKQHQITLECFGVTGTGQPKHPLYVKGDTPLIDWTAPAWRN